MQPLSSASVWKVLAPVSLRTPCWWAHSVVIGRLKRLHKQTVAWFHFFFCSLLKMKSINHTFTFCFGTLTIFIFITVHTVNACICILYICLPLWSTGAKSVCFQKCYIKKNKNLKLENPPKLNRSPLSVFQWKLRNATSCKNQSWLAQSMCILVKRKFQA